MQKVRHLEHIDMLRTYEGSGVVLQSDAPKMLCICISQHSQGKFAILRAAWLIFLFLDTQESARKINNCSQVMSSVKETFYKLG